MVSTAYHKSIATTVLDQLACTSGGTGVNRLRAMVEATNIVRLIASATSKAVPPHSPGVGFRFRGCKDWNGVEIFLDQEKDTYILRFYRMQLEDAGTVLTLGPWIDDIYASELYINFRERTGLDTHL